MPTALQIRGQALVDRLRQKPKPPETRPRPALPRIGIALGGGSARGLTHIPYIEAMDEMGVKPALIAGTSIGALIGAGWASGMTGKELREHAFDVLATMRTIMGRIWTTHMPGLKTLFQNGIPTSLDAARIVDCFTPQGFPAEFKDLRIPLFVVATDFRSWHQAVFSEGPLRPAIGGSIAIPSFFRPVSYANHLLIDGGVVNPLPLDQAAVDSDILIGIDVNGDPAEERAWRTPNSLDLWFGSAQIMMHALTAHMIAAYPPDIYVRPHLSLFGAMEFWRVKEIVAHVESDKDRFKHQLDAKVEEFITGRRRVP